MLICRHFWLLMTGVFNDLLRNWNDFTNLTREISLKLGKIKNKMKFSVMFSEELSIVGQNFQPFFLNINSTD